MGKRLTIEYARQCFLDEGCELLETEYKNNHTKMRYRCSCGNESYICFANFRQGQRCRKCCGSEKITFEFAKQFFKDNDCELLETEYKNSKTKMRYKCSCGDISYINFNNFRQGKRCKKCGIEKRVKKQKHTFKSVEQLFEDEGCILLETEYINVKTKMRYICNCGDISYTTFSCFSDGNRCKKCGYKKAGEKNRFTLEYARQCFEKSGCELLETEYINAHTKMRYICNCGDESKITFANFRQGQRCRKCGIKKIGENQKPTIEYARQCFLDEGCELLETKYIDSHTKMRYRCSCGSISYIGFNSFQRGQRCKKCAIKRNSGKNHWAHNPNLKDKDRIDRRNIHGYNDWVKGVYKRDNYTCQKCEKRKSGEHKHIQIHAHHIDGYAENGDIRTNINNGITFCSDCHYEFHRIYGKKNVTRLQLNEFLQMDLSKK